jgi:hypothetical protein
MEEVLSVDSDGTADKGRREEGQTCLFGLLLLVVCDPQPSKPGTRAIE